MDKKIKKMIGDNLFSLLVGLLIGFGSHSVLIGIGVALIYFRISKLEK